MALFAAGLATFALLYSTQALLPALSAGLSLSPAQASLTVSATTAALAHSASIKRRASCRRSCFWYWMGVSAVTALKFWCSEDSLMDRDTAEKLVAIWHRLDDCLNEATVLIGTIADAEEQRRLRRPVGEMMQSAWVDLMLPIFREFPDLDPDETR